MEVFWLALALIVLLVALRKPLHKVIIGGLDDRAERIRSELDEAARLHKEAGELLEAQKKRLAEGEEHAAGVRAQAEAEAKRIEERMLAEFEALTARRREQADERIRQEQERAVREVRARAADLAARTTRQLLSERVGGDAAQKSMQQAIEEVQRKLA